MTARQQYAALYRMLRRTKSNEFLFSTRELSLYRADIQVKATDSYCNRNKQPLTNKFHSKLSIWQTLGKSYATGKR